MSVIRISRTTSLFTLNDGIRVESVLPTITDGNRYYRAAWTHPDGWRDMWTAVGTVVEDVVAEAREARTKAELPHRANKLLDELVELAETNRSEVEDTWCAETARTVEDLLDRIKALEDQGDKQPKEPKATMEDMYS